MAFHLGCLRVLCDLGILERIGVLSTISGGSVIGAYYAYTPGKSFDHFESQIRGVLRKGFQRRIALELAKPKNLLPCLASFILAQRQEAAAWLWKREPSRRRYPSRTDIFHRVLQRDLFTGLSLDSPRRNGIEIIIGACDLRTGSAFRFGNHVSGSWRLGETITAEIDVAFAVAASAAYPIFLPALDRTWRFRRKGQEREHRIVLTDGGLYDNLGVQVLEPGRNPEVSLHTFPCEYLIVCNAGHGQDSGEGIPMGFLTRVTRSFDVVHRRVQDAAMHHLHHLKESGLIKGFALPYLGQQDDRLPWKPSCLIPREEVFKYPTDFAPMHDEWIDRLSGRGEQLTRLLVTHYLSELLDTPIRPSETTIER